MPSKITKTSSTFQERGVTRYSRYRHSSSAWVLKNGKPDLSVQNPHSFVQNELKSYRVRDPSGSFAEVYPGGVSTQVQPLTAPGIDFAKLEQIALAMYTGKLRKGSASLGVTLGSWGQSSDMIAARLGQASRALSRVHTQLSRDTKRLRKIRHSKDPLANLILEGQFGWVPLIQDIRSSLGVIAGDSIPPAWIVGRHKVDQTFSAASPLITGNGSQGRETLEHWRGSAMVTIAASCSVRNPNAFLLNHLGLLNPLTVAWDLIPWSFVVGMFVNVQAMINSLTNEVGLDVKNKSTTRSCKTQYDLFQQYVWAGGNQSRQVLATGSKTIDHRFRHRTVGSHPALRWQVRVPELNLGLLTTASALVVQRFQRINRLIAL